MTLQHFEADMNLASRFAAMVPGEGIAVSQQGT